MSIILAGGPVTQGERDEPGVSTTSQESVVIGKIMPPGCGGKPTQASSR
jgi:hypothetical protein